MSNPELLSTQGRKYWNAMYNCNPTKEDNLQGVDLEETDLQEVDLLKVEMDE
jgi:uncharacterized protein YjbI with pentapeptide repeats